jgi:hypothetical protein
MQQDQVVPPGHALLPRVIPHLGNSLLYVHRARGPMLFAMHSERIIEQYLEAAINRAYLLGAILGLVAGFVAGALLWP